MKTWFGRAVGLILGLLFFTGCHHHPASVTADDSTAAAAPTAPRAYPVAVPVEAPPSQTLESSSSGTIVTAPVDAATGAPPGADSAATLAPQTGGVTARAPGSDIAMASPSSPDASSGSSAASSSAPSDAPAAAPPDASSSPAAGLSPPSPDDVVVIHTDLGAIAIALDPGAAPETCANFRKLVASRFYDQTAFHRAIPHFIVQVGDPNTKGSDRSTYGDGGPGYTLKPEIKLRHERGAVAMARLPDSVNPGRESNGSQFYICVAPCPTLDEEYTVFGHVILGMDIVDKISELPHDAKYDPDTRVAITADLEPRTQALSSNPNGHP